MLGIFKKFLSKSDDTSPFIASPGPTMPQPADSPKPVMLPKASSRATAAGPAPKTAATKVAPERPATAGQVQITLGTVEASLPESLRHKIVGALSATISVPAAKVLPQLGQGTVVLTIGELRECAPDVLASLAGHDDIPVNVPLVDIVQQLDSSCFARRSKQKTLTVPDDVQSVFAQAAGRAASRPPEPAQHQPVQPVVRMPATATSSIPGPAVVPSKQAKTKKPATAPSANKISLSPDTMASLDAAHAAAKAAASPSVSAPAAAPTHPLTAPASDPLIVPLHKVTGGWPEEIRRDLGDVDIASAELHVPMDLVEPALKSGKVLFTWSEVSTWLQPPMPRAITRSASDIIVDLPLKVLAPLFMAHHRNAANRKTADVGEGIPDLFQSNVAAAEATPRIAAPQPVPQPPRHTNTPVAAEPPRVPPSSPAAVTGAIQMPRMAPAFTSPSTPLPQVAQAPAPTAVRETAAALPALEQVIGTPQRRCSPKEMVQNAAKLPGVSGALLALSDGLLVTSTVDGGVKADMVAAFLPQIFGRMGQYTKELGLGQLQSMALSVEGGCWQVFKQPNIYFAVCGKTGEAMPFNLLAQVAAELSNQQM